MKFIYVNTASIAPCSICGTATQKAFILVEKLSWLCVECLERFAELFEVSKKYPRSERRDVLHCEYWDKQLETYCAERGLWVLYHEGYYSRDRYAVSCRIHLEALSKDYEDGAERLIYVDEPWNATPATDITTSQLRLAAADNTAEPYQAVYITRAGGGLARITYMDGRMWPRPVEGKHAVWIPVEEVAARWPIIGKT